MFSWQFHQVTVQVERKPRDEGFEGQCPRPASTALDLSVCLLPTAMANSAEGSPQLSLSRLRSCPDDTHFYKTAPGQIPSTDHLQGLLASQARAHLRPSGQALRPPDTSVLSKFQRNPSEARVPTDHAYVALPSCPAGRQLLQPHCGARSALGHFSTDTHILSEPSKGKTSLTYVI